jgi:hypothetical protein
MQHACARRLPRRATVRAPRGHAPRVRRPAVEPARRGARHRRVGRDLAGRARPGRGGRARHRPRGRGARHLGRRLRTGGVRGGRGPDRCRPRRLAWSARRRARPHGRGDASRGGRPHRAGRARAVHPSVLLRVRDRRPRPRRRIGSAGRGGSYRDGGRRSTYPPPCGCTVELDVEVSAGPHRPDVHRLRPRAPVVLASGAGRARPPGDGRVEGAER